MNHEAQNFTVIARSPSERSPVPNFTRQNDKSKLFQAK